MIKKLSLATALSALLLSGCGGGGSDGGSNNNGSSNASKLIGTWNNGCESDDGFSEKNTVIFTATTLDNINKEYRGDNCDENELIEHTITKYNYTSGATTKYSNGSDVTELDIVITGFTLKKGTITELPPSGEKHYLMYSIDSDKLYFSDGDETEEFDGSTAVKRSKELDAEYLTKQ